MSFSKATTVAVLIALPEEHESFQEAFPVKSDLTKDILLCLEHESGKEDVRLISILAEQMGSESARNSTEFAIKQFSPDLIVVLGIGGGISSDLTLGDVCVSNEIFDVLHNNKFQDMNNDETGVSLSPNVYSVSAELVASFTFLLGRPSLRPIYEAWRTESHARSSINIDYEGKEYPPKMHIGPIACGPVSASLKFNDKLKQLNRKMAAIETESGGVFAVASRAGIPIVSIRGISDLANSDKGSLEKETKGAVRNFAMLNACGLLSVQMNNANFINVAKRYADSKNEKAQVLLFKAPVPAISPISILEDEIKKRLKEMCPDLKSKSESFYLPVPRASRITYDYELDGRNLEQPENIVDCIKKYDRILVKMPRSFPTQALGWSLAHSLIRQEIDDKVVLPFVLDGSTIVPPKTGLEAFIPFDLKEHINGAEFVRVYIVEEPVFSSRSRMKFFSEEIEKSGAKILILTKSEDHIAMVDDFVSSNDVAEFELTPVSFTETAYFLERTFDMPAYEAEAIAIKLDDTFRKFQLDAHPTYFAGLQEETLAALINANKRAELIQLAVDGLLTLIVAADKSIPTLSRTTRETFLKKLVLEMADSGGFISEEKLSEMAFGFLKEYNFDITQTEFLIPFFQIGLLYKADGKIRFTHPYLESYLLAQALRASPELSKVYFNPQAEIFNFYAFDLYCEMGPDYEVIQEIINYAETECKKASENYKGDHVFLGDVKDMASISSTGQIKSLASRLVKSTEKMEKNNANDDIRFEKQRLLDTRRQVKSEVNNRDVKRNENLPKDVYIEFDTLDKLARCLSLCVVAVGSGSESLSGEKKLNLSSLVLRMADKFTDVWTRNRLRIDFEGTRNDLLSSENIWKFMQEIGAEEDTFDTVKSDLALFIDEMEIRTILEPMRRVIWAITASAGAKVLSPVLQEVPVENSIQEIIKGCWYLDVSPEEGRRFLRNALSDYKGHSLLRLALANHCIARVYWHHYQTKNADCFVASARKALSPLDLSLSSDKVEQAKKGVSSA